MGIFDFSLNDDSSPKQGPPPPTESEVKQSQMRKLGGFDSIKDVADAAPSDYATPVNASPRQSRRESRTGTRSAAASKREIAEQAKEEQKRKAMETVGKHYAKLLAELPYKFWAKFADDPRLSLTPEQSKELADSYYLLAQSINPDFTSPWIIALGVVIQNAILVVERFSMLNDEEKLDKLATEAAAQMGEMKEPSEDDEQ